MNPKRANGLPVDVYIRVSKRGDRSDERFHSPEEQEQLARRYADSIGLKIGEVLPPDIDKSGGTVDRDGIRAALDRVRGGESQGIVVAWIDRFSRDAAQAYDLLREFEAAGGRVFAPEAPEDVSSPEGELQLGMFLLIAQYQRKRARSSFMRSTERATLLGIPVAPVPIGYRKREDRRLEVDPDMAPIVRELFERRAAGAGWTPLADFLSEATGRTWSRQGVVDVVHNRLFATGRLEYGDTVSEHEAGTVVDEALWQAAQRVGRAPRKPRDGAGRWLLSGLLRCDACGHSLVPWKSASRRRHRKTGEWVQLPRRYRRYLCDNRRCPGRTSVAADAIEKLAIIQTITVAHEFATRAAAPDLGALEDDVATAARRLEQVLAPDARDALGELWAADVKARREERDVALARLGEARTRAGVPELAFRLHEVLPDMTPAERRDAMALFWREIRIGAGDNGSRSVTFVSRGPGGTAEVDI